MGPRLRHGRLDRPFGGRAKLGWNLEWAAQWSLFGVTIEPCGKDLSTAGGSRDRADAIAREVFEREPPINVPYEFLNIGGRKMSTSKGHGAAAHKIVEVVPPDQLRFLFIRPRPNSAIEFDPDGTDAIPRLFDEFDRVADATAGREVKGTLPPSPESVFGYAVLATDADVAAEAPAFRLAFAHVAFLIQQPVDPAARAEKGAPLTPREARDPRGAGRRRSALARHLRAGDARGSPSGPTRSRPRPPRCERPARLPRRARRPLPAADRPPGARPGRRPSSRAADARPARRPRVRGAVRGVPRAHERPPRRLAAR